MSWIVGVDIGGTNLRVAAQVDGVTVAQVRRPLGEVRAVDAVLELAAAAIAEVTADAPADTAIPVGVGVAAMLADRRGTIALAPNLGWRDVAFGPALARRLGGRHPVGVYNDVNAIGYGEWVAGAGRGGRDVVTVFVGTGIGGGVITDGALVEGAGNCAGEIGHLKVAWGADAAPCGCGGRGCVEAYVGGAALLTRLRRELAAGASPAVVAAAGAVDAAHPGHVDALADDDPWADALWRTCADKLAMALAGAVVLLNPDRLVLGGGVLAGAPRLRARTTDGVLAMIPDAHRRGLTIAAAELGDDAGWIGAAHLAARGVSLAG